MPITAVDRVSALRQRLETGRLVLRRHVRTDARPIAELLNDWEVARWLAQVPFPYTERDAVEWIHQTGRDWRDRRDYQFVVTEREGERMVGHMGVRADPREAAGEIGYWFGRDHWGKGYGAEAARAMVSFAFEDLGLDRLWATYLPENVRSLNVLSKAGLMPDGFRETNFAALNRTVRCPRMALERNDYLAAAAQ
ncbi:GNAT family N-acetyltransferase [Inquilinus sp. CAU 1745]|uniref:GNAT family N-acetyltransferase n=1 Tax=Inquilinus sp. CAU 1745 TaxID=3140369 RepID=UPI00325AF805